jgi:DhnA family fructose-bisphosphate aldolase class Ia
MTGREVRLSSIFREDGRAVVVALDHGGIAGPLPGIEDPRETVRACVEGGADAILTTRGVVKAALPEWRRQTSIILRATGGFTTLGGGFEEELISTPQAALAAGAACLALTVKFGHPREGHFISKASLVADECAALGLPLMIEALLGVPGMKAGDPEGIMVAARAAQELGADIVKTRYTGSPESFRRVTAGCPVPVLILGGEAGRGAEALFSEVRDSLEAGGRGVAIGRALWSSGQSKAMVEALVGLVHEDWSLAQALGHLA